MQYSNEKELIKLKNSLKTYSKENFKKLKDSIRKYLVLETRLGYKIFGL